MKSILTLLLCGLLTACALHSTKPALPVIDIDPSVGDMNLPVEQQTAEHNFILGEAHAHRHTSEDDTKAVPYYLAAAAQGNTDAQARLGAMLLAGKGVKANPEQAARWLRRAAKEGVVDAQTSLGAIYEHGMGVDVDESEAEKWYLLAVKRNNVDAMLGLVRIYRVRAGNGEAQKEAVLWANRAADLNAAEGHYRLAEFYEFGVGVVRDIKKAMSHYEKAAQMGYVEAYPALARIYVQDTAVDHPSNLYQAATAFGEGDAAVIRAMQYELGDGVPQDFGLAMQLYKEAADNGYPYAAYRVGRLYQQQGRAGRMEAVHWLEQAANDGVVAANVDLGQLYMTMSPPDWHKVQAYFQLAAERGNPFSQYMLSILYRHPPHGLQEDLKKSVFWYQKAEDSSGHAYAQYEIGIRYATGQGFQRDFFQAFKWYLVAAERDVVEAQVALGHLYLNGRGVLRDPVEAANWYKRASVGGSAAAKYFLGLMYFNGQGFDRPDHKTAALWLTLAAKERFAPAQFRLAEMYFEGDGVPQSDVKAYAWWSLCAEGHYEARFAGLDTLIQRMTPHEMKKAVALAQEYAAAYSAHEDPM